MTDVDNEDSLTRLNTQLNRSMVLIESAGESIMESTPQIKSNKSIKINTKVQPPSTPNNHHNAKRKSILKKVDKSVSEQSSSEEIEKMESESEEIDKLLDEKPINSIIHQRPHNIQELVVKENLTVNSTSSTFDLNDLSDSEEVWVMDIPKTIDPQDLNGQKLMVGDKSKLKIRQERYCAVTHNVRCNMTCVFSSGKAKRKFKTVNVKPAGLITIRRKLSGLPKIEPISMERTEVPFPQNLRVRHPILGINYDESSSNKSKKHVRRK